MNLYLKLNPKFDRDSGFRVVGCFLPNRQQMCDDGTEYFPFLVIGVSDDNITKIWTPYWHRLKDGQLRYGQWAPYMVLETFKDLVDQAREKRFDV
jgi:hypothetical protein